MTDQVRKVDIYSGYRFRVEIDGTEHGGFRERSGLDTSQDPIEYRESADPGRVSGLDRKPSIVLKAGISSDAELWEWRWAAKDGRAVCKNGTIIMLDEAGHEAMRWRFTRRLACPMDRRPVVVPTGVFGLEGRDLRGRGQSQLPLCL